jgi:hypothetical protein
LEKHLKDVAKKIKDHPRPCSEAPQSTVLDLCDKFVDKIRKHTEGARGNEDFFQNITDDFELLKKKLHETHPRFVLDGHIQDVLPAETTSETTSDPEETESESVKDDAAQGILLRLGCMAILTFP